MDGDSLSHPKDFLSLRLLARLFAQRAHCDPNPRQTVSTGNLFNVYPVPQGGQAQTKQAQTKV